MEQAFQPLPFCRVREDPLPDSCTVETAVGMQNLLAKMLGDDSQCRFARFHDDACHDIGVDDIDTQCLKYLSGGALAAANATGQANDEWWSRGPVAHSQPAMLET